MIKQDKNGIWTSNIRHQVDYPNIGNQNSQEVESNSFWFAHRNSVIARIIKRFPFTNDFVDVGGGNGFQIKYLSHIFHKKNFYLVEPGYQGCLSAKRNGLKLVYNVKFSEFPIHKFNIGGIGLFDVIEHLRNEVFLLKDIARRSKKNTLIYVTVPTYRWLWSDTDDYSLHFRRYDKTMVEQLAKQSKLRIVYLTYFFSYLIPLTFLFRVIPYKLGFRMNDEKLIAREKIQHQGSGVAKSIFNKLGEFELDLLRNKSISYGTSLLVVFQVP